MRSINSALRPRFFISYSRRDQVFVEMVSNLFNDLGSHAWFDLNEISVGADWRDDIVRGIRNSDEVILILTPNSVSSSVVLFEIETAQHFRKPVRPILASGDIDIVPEAIRSFNILDITNLDVASQLSRIEEIVVGPPLHANPDYLAAHQLEIYASRIIYPPFTYQSQNLNKILNILKGLAANANEESVVYLNYGLNACRLRQYAVGLEHIQSYALVANNFVGWYYVALNMLRGRSMRSLPQEWLYQGAEAIARSRSLQHHPLIIAATALYAVALNQKAVSFLDEAAGEVIKAAHQTNEAPSEFNRALAIFTPTFDQLGRHGHALRKVLSEGTQHERI